MLNIKISGAVEVAKTLKRLPSSMQDKAINPAMERGGDVVRKAASENVKSITSDKATGLLANNIKTYWAKRWKGMKRITIGVKRGLIAKNRARVGLYAAVLEYGKNDGSQPPRSWIRKAAREKPAEVLNVMTEEIARQLDSVIKDAKSS